MLNKINIANILFLDIETVPEVESFAELSDEKQELFALKTQYQRKDEVSAEEFYERAGIWAEFGKIICIFVGFFTSEEDQRTFRVKSLSGNEKELLQSFKNLIESHFNKPQHLLCAHNGKEFDFPYIARRMIINGMELPDKLNLFGKKPWEVAHLDTMDLWKFGDYKHFTSLRLLTNILNIPSPKDEIDGSDVARVYYQEQNLEKIINYCEKDTIAVAQLVLRFRNLELLKEKEIIKV
ncbi:MAG: 3'-5' exonuclease [Flavobacteriaceae bacterium]|nr:3'-5' exonuclease [Flavobacteriaceae bacterium]